MRILMMVAAVSMHGGAFEESAKADDLKSNAAGVLLKTENFSDRHAELAKRIELAPSAAMKSPGLAGTMGAARVRVFLSAPQEIILPIPQLTGGQAPVVYFVRSEPADAVSAYRLWDRGAGNVVLRVRLAAKLQEVRIQWASVVLIANSQENQSPSSTEAFLSSTSCVQSKSREIEQLAGKLWPASGKKEEFARNIQRHVREMKRVKQPRSLDALGILASGANGICTANANLAAALMRSEGIPCRTLAVIPPNGMKLEMHRVVEFFDQGKWVGFDPSALAADIPMKPWRNIVMAVTSLKDEEVAMKPRMSVMFGCPYGQELEMLTPGAALFGQDFFWTQAKPLAEFEPTEVAVEAAKKSWSAFLKSGAATAGRVEAGKATSARGFVESIKRP